MIDYLINIDTDLFLWLNSRHSAYWDIVMKMASSKLVWVPMYIALLYTFCRAYGWRSALTAVLLTIFAVAAADQITASLLRPYFERMRPSNLSNPISDLVHIVDGYRAGRYGFPSSHAANTFAVGVFTSLVFNRWKYTVFIFSWALLNCYSRTYLGVHYPGDLLAGMIVGAFCGAVAFMLGVFAVRIFSLDRFGESDKQRIAFINGSMVNYRISDIVIIVGLLTMSYILICGFSVFY